MRFGSVEETLNWYFTKKEIDVAPFLRGINNWKIDSALRCCFNTAGYGYSIKKYEEEVTTAVDIEKIALLLSGEDRREVFIHYFLDDKRYITKASEKALMNFKNLLLKENYVRNN